MFSNIQSALVDAQSTATAPAMHSIEQSNAPLFIRSISILVVDSNEDQAEMFATLLNIYGHDVVCVSTGLEALASARQRNFEVIYICSSSAKIAPFELVEKLKTFRHLADTFFVAMSGHAGLSYRTSALKVGFSYVVVKPAGIGDLCAPVIDKANKLSK